MLRQAGFGKTWKVKQIRHADGLVMLEEAGEAGKENHKDGLVDIVSLSKWVDWGVISWHADKWGEATSLPQRKGIHKTGSGLDLRRNMVGEGKEKNMDHVETDGAVKGFPCC